MNPTHEVFNQTEPLVNVNLFAGNRALQAALAARKPPGRNAAARKPPAKKTAAAKPRSPRGNQA